MNPEELRTAYFTSVATKNAMFNAWKESVKAHRADRHELRARWDAARIEMDAAWTRYVGSYK